MGIIARTTNADVRNGRLILLPSSFRCTAGRYNSYYGGTYKSLPLRQSRKSSTSCSIRGLGRAPLMAGVGARV